MYPKNISDYLPTDSERIVFHELKKQLPDSFEVFYSVSWTSCEAGTMMKSEADFIIVSPEYGFLCLEVKGGNGIRVENNIWYVNDATHGERRLNTSPYCQAEKSMYYFKQIFSNKYNTAYQGIFGAGVIFPFYPISNTLQLDKRDRECTIDCNDLNNLFDRVKKMFRFWAGRSYGMRHYALSQHKAFLDLVRERIAISAAAGALVQYKEQQLSVINRVQDNYVYFLSNVRQFFIRGGAGTGKTWIAMKMSFSEAYRTNKKVAFLCTSPHLAVEVRTKIGDYVEVYCISELFEKIAHDFYKLEAPRYHGVFKNMKSDIERYDAIFIDEAQDFSEEWAKVVRELLVDKNTSRLGVFYDDVQVLREDSFGDGFKIKDDPFLLRENIRNTSSIYQWTAEKTNLGTDVIANPVEGPTPITEYIMDFGHMTNYLETTLRRYLVDEYLPNSSLVVLTDDVDKFMSFYSDGIAIWKFINGPVSNNNEIKIMSVEEFKGLESDMVIYIHGSNVTENMNYIAYTRAKFYLIEMVRKYE